MGKSWLYATEHMETNECFIVRHWFRPWLAVVKRDNGVEIFHVVKQKRRRDYDG